jgi:hypothetical protein
MKRREVTRDDCRLQRNSIGQLANKNNAMLKEQPLFYRVGLTFIKFYTIPDGFNLSVLENSLTIVMQGQLLFRKVPFISRESGGNFIVLF